MSVMMVAALEDSALWCCPARLVACRRVPRSACCAGSALDDDLLGDVGMTRMSDWAQWILKKVLKRASMGEALS